MNQPLRTLDEPGERHFTLQIPTDSGPVALTCSRIVRCLPGRRLGCIAEWQGRPVFAKLFIDRRRARVHWQREERGNRTLRERGIAAPASVHSGPLADNLGYALLFEWIAHSRSALECWESGNDSARSRLLLELADLLADHHRQGIAQQDLHLDNFLCADGRIHTLDGADITVAPKPLGRRRALNNLALLLAQLPGQSELMIDAVHTHYAAARGWAIDARQRRTLRRMIDRQRLRRRNHLFKRIMRNCRDFTCHRSWRNLTVYDKRYGGTSLERLLADPDRAIAEGTPLKLGNSATVARVELDGRVLVIKRYNIKNRLHGLKRALRPSRAAVSWRNAHRLLFYGIRTPIPVALIERRFGPVRRSAYFISEHIEGVDCRAWFGTAHSQSQRGAISEQIVTTLETLARHRISHGDLKATNWLVSGDRVFLIDLDATRQHLFGHRFRRMHRRDLARFFRNWQDRPEIEALFRDRLERAG